MVKKTNRGSKWGGFKRTIRKIAGGISKVARGITPIVSLLPIPGARAVAAGVGAVGAAAGATNRVLARSENKQASAAPE